MLRGHFLKSILTLIPILFSIGAQAQLTYQKMKFFVSPELLQGATSQEIGGNLIKYVNDLNSFYAKQTIRRFVFDPSTDLVFGPFVAQQANGTDIHVEILKSTTIVGGQLLSNGGYAGGNMLTIGGQIRGLSVNKIYDPLDLPTDYDRDNYLRRQWLTLVHELAHIFGGGIGEYYSLSSVRDNTGESPLVNISLMAGYPDMPTDPFWIARQDYLTDPLLASVYGNPRFGSPTTRADVFAATAFSRASLAMINASWTKSPAFDCNLMPEIANSRVHVKDAATGAPLSNTMVKVWRIVAAGDPMVPVLLGTGVTDVNGRFTFNWTSGCTPLNNYENKVLVKTYADGYEPKGTWYSIYDHLEKRFLDGQAELIVPVSMVATDVEPPTPPQDSIIPTVQILSPADGANFQLSQLVNMSFSASDNVGINLIQVYVNNVQVCQISRTPYNCNNIWRTENIAKSYQIEVKAYDVAGNVGIQRITVTAGDSVKPVIVSTTPNGASVLKRGTDVSLSVNATDNVGVTKVEFRVNGALICSDASSPYQCTWRVPSSATTASFDFRAYDIAGNVTTSTLAVPVDSVAPVVSITAPASGQSIRKNTTVFITGVASDAIGVTSVIVKVQGATVCTISVANSPSYNYSCRWTAPAATGSKTILVETYDRANNKGMKSFSVKIIN